MGWVAALPGGLAGRLGGVLYLHSLVDVERYVGDVRQREREDDHEKTEFDRGDAALVGGDCLRPMSETQRSFAGRIQPAREPRFHKTNVALPGIVVEGIDNPAGIHSPFGRIIPVPFTVMSLTTIAKQDFPNPALFTAPLNVTLEFGR